MNSLQKKKNNNKKQTNKENGNIRINLEPVSQNR